MLRQLISRLAARLRSEDGSMVVESALVLPFLFWGYLGLYTYWDAYRALATVQKATYAISDLISREQRAVNAPYINGMRRVMDSMLSDGQSTELRVTSVTYSGVRNQYEVEWSNSPSGGMLPLTTPTLQGYLNRVPTLNDGDSVVIVETRVEYEPSIQYGLAPQTFEQFVVTRPRFVPRVVFQ